MPPPRPTPSSDSGLRAGFRVAIAGGGISGLAVAWELARQGIEFTLFEASARLGGIIETVRREGFIVECGPDSWVAEKPWARQLAVELGLEEQIVHSNDRWRRTYLVQGAGSLAQGAGSLVQGAGSAPRLIAVPDGMRMMVPAKWGPVLESPLLSWQARLAYLREPKRAEELKASAPAADESVATFIRRHFGDEVARTLAAPLLAAVLGGDVESLSARAVLPAFVAMERDQGSLILALRKKEGPENGGGSRPIFATLAGGLETLVERMAESLPPGSIQLRQEVLGIEPGRPELAAGRPVGWQVATTGGLRRFDALVLATPSGATARLLRPLGQRGARMAALLPRQSTSAVVAAFAFAPAQAARMRIPRGFGFVAPPTLAVDGAEHPLLACTFIDQKFPSRAPEGAAILRAFFGGSAGEGILRQPDDVIADCARRQLSRVLGPLAEPAFTIVRRWPGSLPQYEVGHLERLAELKQLAAEQGALHLAGNAYEGVGLPDLIRGGRAIGCLLTQTARLAGER